MSLDTSKIPLPGHRYSFPQGDDSSAITLRQELERENGRFVLKTYIKLNPEHPESWHAHTLKDGDPDRLLALLGRRWVHHVKDMKAIQSTAENYLTVKNHGRMPRQVLDKCWERALSEYADGEFVIRRFNKDEPQEGIFQPKPHERLSDNLSACRLAIDGFDRGTLKPALAKLVPTLDEFEIAIERLNAAHGNAIAKFLEISGETPDKPGTMINKYQPFITRIQSVLDQSNQLWLTMANDISLGKKMDDEEMAGQISLIKAEINAVRQSFDRFVSGFDGGQRYSLRKLEAQILDPAGDPGNKAAVFAALNTLENQLVSPRHMRDTIACELVGAAKKSRH